MSSMTRPTQSITRAKRFYMPRSIGLSLGFVTVFASLPAAPAHRLALALLIGYCFGWPHIAFLLAKRSDRPLDTERRNMLFDTFAAGFFAGHDRCGG